MKKSEEFENEISNSEKVKKIIEKEENDIFKVKKIDSKKAKEYRTELFKPFDKFLDEKRKKYKNLSNSNFSKAYALRGDNLFIGKKKILISDSKDYEKIQGLMHFPKSLENIEKFKKTTDTNLRYLCLFDFLTKNKIIKSLLNKDLSSFEEKKYGEIEISKKEFLEIFNFFEFGFLKEKLKIEEKYFISNEKTVIRKLNKFNFEKNLSNNINIEIWIEKKYLYFLFKENNICFYIISQRSNGKKGNCSFINIDYLKLVGKFKKEEK
jgi:hypothetical protein